ncbi:hypothetical protein GCM10009731_61000 [Streptomyces globosus]
MHLDRAEPGVDRAHALGRVAGGLGGADLAPPDRVGEAHGVVLAEGVVPEGVHTGPFVECRHRYPRPAACVVGRHHSLPPGNTRGGGRYRP